MGNCKSYIVVHAKTGPSLEFPIAVTQVAWQPLKSTREVSGETTRSVDETRLAVSSEDCSVKVFSIPMLK